MREIHFYTSLPLAVNAGVNPRDELLLGWDTSEHVIRRMKQAMRIHTLQMGLLNEAWDKHCAYGDRVFIHDGAGCFELKEDCERTGRRLKPSHNVFKLWRGGEFNKRAE